MKTCWPLHSFIMGRSAKVTVTKGPYEPFSFSFFLKQRFPQLSDPERGGPKYFVFEAIWRKKTFRLKKIFFHGGKMIMIMMFWCVKRITTTTSEGLIGRNSICAYSDNLLIVDIFQAIMPNVWWFYVLKCENSLRFLVFHHCILNILGFWTVGWWKTRYLGSRIFIFSVILKAQRLNY